MALFDAVIESSKAGVRKPDPRIYQMMCELLEVAPAACVYLDDLGVNCKPAAALGMTAIKVVSEAQALDDLARVTGLTEIVPSPAEARRMTRPAADRSRRPRWRVCPAGRPRKAATRSSRPSDSPTSTPPSAG